VWNPLTATGRAALDGTITQQAMAIAYLDDFKFMMLISLIVMPLVLLFKRPKQAGAPSPTHAAVMD
jgi:DHA2 family multidrug resistance protein